MIKGISLADIFVWIISILIFWNKKKINEKYVRLYGNSKSSVVHCSSTFIGFLVECLIAISHHETACLNLFWFISVAMKNTIAISSSLKFSIILHEYKTVVI